MTDYYRFIIYMSQQLIAKEDFTSVNEAQAGISKLFKKAKDNNKFYRVMRNQEALGVLIPNRMWLSLVEDLEASKSTGYLKAIKESRQNKVRVTSQQAKKALKI